MPSATHAGQVFPPAGLALLCILLAGTSSSTAQDSIRFVPPWLTSAVVYHNGFDGEGGVPTVCSPDLQSSFGAAVPAADNAPVLAEQGLLGRGLHVRDGRAPFTLTGPPVSPHRPLTLSFWWALPYDLTLEGGYQLFQLNGRGMVALFSRGKGEWCALQRPAGVFQVYYFEGIQDVNGIYDDDLLSHHDLRAGVWHHAAVVFRRADTAQAYIDGRLVFEVTVKGRRWTAEDALEQLTLGGPLYLDEVLLLDRAVDADLLADYHRGMVRLREYVGQ